MRKVILILSIILLSAMWTSTLLYGKIPSRERLALERLFEKAGGDNWKIEKPWKVGHPKEFRDRKTECEWGGIICDKKKSTVLGIKLNDKNLSGEIPADLVNLRKLEILVLSNNKLTKVDKNVGNLTNLTTLNLSNNELKGEIPGWIKNLKNLRKLNLSNNRFTGRIPEWIGNLKELKELHLNGNHLTGKIPSPIKKLSYLETCDLRWNGLYTDEASVRTFLKGKQKGENWESTQTIAPKIKSAVSHTKTSVTIKWEPIAYTDHGGGYRIFYGTTPGTHNEKGPIINNKKKGNGVVTELDPSTPYYFVVRTWTSIHDGNPKNTVTSEASKEESAVTQGHTISGYVRTSDGQGVPGVKLTASNGGGSDTTKFNGKYKLGVKDGWSGTVTLSKEGYTFRPAQKDYSNVTEDIINRRYYIATPIAAISGAVTELGDDVPGVKLTFESKEETTATETNSKGIYSHALKKYKWTGTVTPSKTGYKFEPDQVKKKDIIGKEIQDFKTIPPKISGKVTDFKGKGIKDVILTSPKNEEDKKEFFRTKTNENGEYSQAVPTNWSGNVKPSLKGYVFYPAKRFYQNIKVEDEDKIEGNYKAELDLKLFISVTGNYMIPPERDLKDVYGSRLFTPELKVGYKFYRAFYVWGGFAFSTKSGKSLNPPPEEPSPAKWKQTFLSLGLGYNGNMSIKFGYKAEVGMFYVSFRDEMHNIVEEGVTYSESGTAVGVRIDGAAVFKISDLLFAEISMGYLYASDKIDDISVELGGLKAGVGLGLRF